MKHTIEIVGLGPADGLQITSRAMASLKRQDAQIWLRTSVHPAADDLRTAGVNFDSFDPLYKTCDSFKTVYEQIVERILEIAKMSDVVYAVPGHPLVAEETVRQLLIRAHLTDIAVRIVGSSGFIEPTLEALELSLNDGIVIQDALTLENSSLRPDLGLMLYQVYDQSVASSVKLHLMKEFPDDWEIAVVRSAGHQPNQEVSHIPLFRLDRIEVDHLTTVYVPPLPIDSRRKRFDDLVEVMARLRGPDGCPWDHEQDHKTLRRYMVEECYEAIEAIDRDDMDLLCEELGDVLLQVVFHAQIEAESGIFDVRDVITHIVEKLVRRHPHVFGEVSVADSEEVLRNWEQIKGTEKGNAWRESVLDGVPKGLPSLMLAMEISKKAAKTGFEWEKFEDVLAKMDEEIIELRAAIASGNKTEIASELGDLLFTLVNVARWQKVDPEDSLREMTQRFAGRFRTIEAAAREQNRPIEDLTLAEMDELWDQAKRTISM